MFWKRYRTAIISLAIGLFLIASAYIYDASVNAIGVNFGAAFIWMFGIVFCAISFVMFVVIALASQKDTKMKIAVLLLAIGFATATFGIFTADIVNLEEVERLHGCNDIRERIKRPDKYCGDLKGAPEAVLNYINPTSSIGLVLTIGGATTIILSRRRLS